MEGGIPTPLCDAAVGRKEGGEGVESTAEA